jgi:hypothetical protein
LPKINIQVKKNERSIILKLALHMGINIKAVKQYLKNSLEIIWSNDLEALTHGHFLTREPLASLPEDDLTDLPMTRLQMAIN